MTIWVIIFVIWVLEVRLNTSGAPGRDKHFSLNTFKKGYNAVTQLSFVGQQEQATGASAQNLVSKELSVITVRLKSLLTGRYF